MEHMAEMLPVCCLYRAAEYDDAFECSDRLPLTLPEPGNEHLKKRFIIPQPYMNYRLNTIFLLERSIPLLQVNRGKKG